MCFAAIATAMGASTATAATVGTVAPAVISGASTMIQMGAQVKAGEERKKQANETARQVALDNELAKVESMQQSRAMFEQYQADSNINQAFFSYLGIDDSQSIKAFNEGQKKLINEKELRRKTQDSLESAKSRSEVNTLRQSGRASLAAGQINAVSTLLSGGISIYEHLDKD